MTAQLAMKLMPAILPPAKRASVKVAVEGTAKLGMDIQFNRDDTHQIASMCAPILATVLLGIGIYWLKNRNWKTALERATQFLRTLRYRWKLTWPEGGVRLLRPPKTPPRDPAAYKYIGKGKSRMTVELCTKCVETNRFLRNLAEGAGLQHDTFEACEDCRRAMLDMEQFKNSPKLGLRC